MSTRPVLAVATLLVPALVGCAMHEPVDRVALSRRLSEVEAQRRHELPTAAPANSSRFAAELARTNATLGDLAADAPESGDTQLADSVSIQPGNIDRESAYLRRGLLPSFGQTVKRDAKNVGSDLWRDTKRVYGNPVNLAILGVTYGGTLALQETGPDDTVEDHYNRHSTFNDGWNESLATLGNPGVHLAVAGVMYAAGQQLQDEKTYEVSRALFSALIINGISSVVGQAVTADDAPNGEFGSFPSGHTSSSFAVATVMNEAYGPLVGVPLYGAATLVGISRLDDREHYLSDVVFGAVMGTVIGHSVATGRDPEFFGWQVIPYADPATGSTGVALGKSFK